MELFLEYRYHRNRENICDLRNETKDAVLGLSLLRSVCFRILENCFGS